MNQRERLEAVLRDGYPHRSDELVLKVYGASCPLARLAARVHDVRKKLSGGWRLRGWKDRDNAALFWYQLVQPAPILPSVAADYPDAALSSNQKKNGGA